MSKIKREKPSSNGITFYEEVTLRLDKEQKLNIYLRMLQILLILLSIVGMANCFISGFKLQVQPRLLYGGILLFIGLYVVVFYFREYLKLSIPCLFASFGVVLYIFQEQLKEGSAMVANEFIWAYNEYANTSLPLFLTNEEQVSFYTTIVLLFVYGIVIGAVSYVVFQRANITTYFLVSLPIVFACFVVGKMPDAISFMIYLIATMGVIGGSMTGYKGVRMERRRFSKRRSVATVQEKQDLEVVRIKVASIFLMMVTFSLLVSYSLFSSEKYNATIDIQEIKARMQDTIENIEAGKITKDTILDGLFAVAKSPATAGLSGGNLGNNEAVTFQNKTALEVVAPLVMKDTYYLRGYVGSQYSNNKWKQLSKSDQKKYAELEASLTKDGSGTENLNATYFKDSSQISYFKQEFASLQMSIKNVDAGDDNFFVPYGITDNIALNKNGKVKFKEEKEDKEYGFSYNEPSNIFPESYSSSTKEGWDINYPFSLLVNNYLNRKAIELSYGNTLEEYLDNEEVNPNLLIGEMDPSYDAIDIEIEESNKYGSFLVGPLYDGWMAMDEAIEEIQDLDAYAVKENAYRSLVYQMYTKLPEGQQDKIPDFANGMKIESTWKEISGDRYEGIEEISSLNYMSDVVTRINIIREYLNENTSYSLSPGALPQGEDFIEYFLYENKKGYCMHYASAATIMFRAMGIPARYVEGYIVTEEDFNKGEKATTSTGALYRDFEKEVIEYDNVKMKIKDTNAHAWVEIYVDGYGWTPVEVTPGYSDGSRVTIPDQITNFDQKESDKPGVSPSVKPTTLTKKPEIKPTPTKTPAPKADLDTNNKDQNSVATLFFNVLKVVLMLLLTIAAFAGAMLIRRSLIVKKRNAIKKAQNISKKALSEYYELSKILNHYQLNYEGRTSVKEFANQVEKQFSFLSSGTFEHFFKIILKARFSKEWITDSEYEEIHKFYEDFRNGVYQEAPKRKRIYYKYFKLF